MRHPMHPCIVLGVHGAVLMSFCPSDGAAGDSYGGAVDDAAHGAAGSAGLVFRRRRIIEF